MLLTHAYANLLADMHLAVFAPAFTFSLCESEAPANRRMRIASVISHNIKKMNKTVIFIERKMRKFSKQI